MRTSLLLALLLVAGCDAVAPAPDVAPVEPPDTLRNLRSFVPLEQGNRWDYVSVEGGGYNFSVAMTRTKRDGHSVFRLGSTYGAYNLSEFFYTPAGLRRVRYSPDGSISRDATFRFDLQPSVQATIPGRPGWTFTTRVVTRDTVVTTAAGAFQAVGLETTWATDGWVRSRETEYVAEGVGVVRYVYRYAADPPLVWDLSSFLTGLSPERP